MLAFSATILFVASALLAPLAAAQVPGSISGAIDEGAQQSVAGLLPTSEAYQRAMQVADGLKAGVPSPAPVLSTAQLNDVTAIARGAVKGALTDPTTITSSDERAKLQAFARGWLSGAVSQLAAAPTSGRTAVDEAVSKGVFTGAAQAVLGPEATATAADLEAYARTLAAGAFDELDANGGLLAGLAGSPALADVTLFASELARAQIEALPLGLARAQLDAIATFGAGTLDGMVVGVVTGFPSGVPAPGEDDLRRWFQSVAEGHSGTAPWSEPASLPLLLAWADASAATAVLAVDEARDNITSSSAPETLDELGAWAVGSAHGAYERLDALVASTPGIERDVRAYAEALTAPGITFIVGTPHPDLNDTAVAAYAEGLAGGVDDMRGATLDALGLTESFLEDVASAVTDLPALVAPAQSAALEAYLVGVTDRITVRLDGIAALVSEDDPALLGAMAEGLGAGAVGLAGGPALTRPELAQAIGNGLSSGAIESRNPRVLSEAAFGYLEAAKAWIGATPPVSLVAINDIVQSAGRDPYNALQQYGQTMGRAPVSWAENKSLGAADQGWGGADDLLWLASFTNASVPIILDEIKQGLQQPDPTAALNATNAYAANVTGKLGDPDLTAAIGNLTSSEYRAHARRFAQFALTPLDWTGRVELAAAREVIAATFGNATDIERFRDAEYSQAAIAFLDAVGDGLREGRPEVVGAAKELKGEGFVPPWVRGVVDAIQDVPTSEVRGDVSSRVEWIRTATKVVRPLAHEAVGAQVPATREFARDTAHWAMTTPERLPPPGGFSTPVIDFLQASLNATLASLPPVMTDEEREAVVGYADGIQRAINATPAVPNPLDWSLPDAAAMDAYVGGIAAGLAQVQDDTRLYLCSWDINTSECPPKPPRPPRPPGPCEFDCQFLLYVDNLGAWSENLTASGLDQMEAPNATPTRTGIAFVARWSAEVLAGHGFCADLESATFDCEGPRGPVEAFAQARNESVAAWAEAISQGYASYIDLSDPPAGLARPITDPILAWAAGVQNAVGVGLLQPDRFLPAEGGDPADPASPVGAPPQDPSDPAFREELRVWTDSVLRAPGRVYDGAWVPFPDTTGFNATIADLDYVLGHVLWEGGYDALNQSSTNLSRVVINATPDAALDAFAEGIVNATRDIIVQPAADDLQPLLAWYQGLAEGGVEAILAGAGTISAEQVPAIEAWAHAVAAAFAPPAPPVQSVVDFLAPPDGEEEPEEPPAEEPSGPSAEETYLANLQAHAEGLAAAVLDAPTKGATTNTTTYASLHLAYVQAIADAAQRIPPVSPDAGFPARLSAWTQAQAEAASRAPPTSPERVGPSPNAAMALAYVEAFAGTSPWNLPPDATDKLAWAQAAVAGGLGVACPSANVGECEAIGAALGEAFGVAIPQEMPAAPVPLPEQAALVAAMAGALAPALDAIPPSWLAPAAQELAATLATADPARYQALAEGAVAILVARAASGDADPTAAQQELRDYLAPEGAEGPSVVVGDGERSYTAAQLAAGDAPALDGLKALRVDVHAPPSSPVQSSWELVWSADDPRAPGAQRVALAGRDGAYGATIAPSAFASLARGATVRFVLVETTPAGSATYPASGAYAFVPDRDAPTVTLTTPANAPGASFLVSWRGSDGDSGVASYQIDVREGSGDWRNWIASTSSTEASFSGVAGRSYAFRATAVDDVGHASPPSSPATTAIPANAAANRAPTVAFVAPAADAVFGRSVAVVLALADPDGTEPMVRLCFRAEGATIDADCADESTLSTVSLDAARLADGRYRLHARATDGTLTAEATSPVFAIDRSPPTFRGAAAEADPTRVLLSASADDASAVVVDVDGRTVPLVESTPGVWTGATSLSPGEHTLSFRATDPNGNDATLERTITVPLPKPPAGTPATPTPGATPTPPTGTTIPPTDADTPGAPIVLLLAALAAVAIALRRRRA